MSQNSEASERLKKQIKLALQKGGKPGDVPKFEPTPIDKSKNE
jgi:hypothetical protein